MPASVGEACWKTWICEISTVPMIKALVLVIILAIVVGGAGAAWSFRHEVSQPVIVLAGQSNALGMKADAALLTDVPKGTIWWSAPGLSDSDHHWVPLEPQAGLFQAGFFGPEMGIAQEEHSPAIFKFAQTSTSLGRDWKSLGDGGLLDHMQTELQLALAALKTSKISCIVWVQGESDAETPDLADAYEMELTNLVKEFRASISETARIVLSVDELHPWVKENPQVVSAQKRVAEITPNVVFVGFSDLEKADTTHLTAAAVIKQGQRYGNACMQ